jgi:hypothetical protein
MSTTLVGLSDSILASEYIRSHPQLITSVRASVQRALTLAENATREADEEKETDDDDQENRQGHRRRPNKAVGFPVLQVTERAQRPLDFPPGRIRAWRSKLRQAIKWGRDNVTPSQTMSGGCRRRTPFSRENSGVATTVRRQECTWSRGRTSHYHSGTVCCA